MKPDAFLVIQESETRHLENLVDNSGDEYYISRLVLSRVTPADAGMYICVVNDQDEGKSTFKYAYLQVEDGMLISKIFLLKISFLLISLIKHKEIKNKLFTNKNKKSTGGCHL